MVVPDPEVFSMRDSRLASVALVAVIVTVVLSGCGNVEVTYVDKGNEYTRASALKLLDGLSSGALSERPTSDSQELRSEALTLLRREGENASEAASLVTSTLPEDSQSVPFYVERARYEGDDAVLIVEAIGPSSGALSDKRLWVLSEDGDVLLSGNR